MANGDTTFYDALGNESLTGNYQYDETGTLVFVLGANALATVPCMPAPVVPYPDGSPMPLVGENCDQCSGGAVLNLATQSCECPEGMEWDSTYFMCVAPSEVEEEVVEEEEEEAADEVDADALRESADSVERGGMPPMEQPIFETPATYTDFNSNTIEFEAGELEFDPAQYDEPFQDIIQDIPPSGPPPRNSMERLENRNIKLVPPPSPPSPTSPTPYYVAAADVLADGTKFTNENLFKLFTKPESMTNEERAASTLLNAMADLLAGKNKTDSFKQDSITIDDFNRPNRKGRPLPPQYKDLMPEQASKSGENWTGGERDPFNDPDTSAMMFFKYLMIYRAEVMEADDIKNPKWRALTMKDLNAIKGGQGSLIVRWKKYNTDDFVPGAKTETNTRVFDEFFFIRDKTKKVSRKRLISKGPGCGTTAFGNRVLQQMKLAQRIGVPVTSLLPDDDDILEISKGALRAAKRRGDEEVEGEAMALLNGNGSGNGNGNGNGNGDDTITSLNGPPGGGMGNYTV